MEENKRVLEVQTSDASFPVDEELWHDDKFPSPQPSGWIYSFTSSCLHGVICSHLLYIMSWVLESSLIWYYNYLFNRIYYDGSTKGNRFLQPAICVCVCVCVCEQHLLDPLLKSA